uniref:Prolyl 4-hydroxylase alpha subunit domain-containing protein n=1 Tax=Periophthalmus magnuspinnatus TaxID=409849 RepID=A0A3B3ZJY9_9GOBI
MQVSCFSIYFRSLCKLSSHSFYAKVSHLHSDVYKGQATALANPLLAFTLIKRLYSEWPTHFQNPRLFCDYFTSGSPGLIVHPAKREILSLQPFVVLYHDFITHTEAEDVKRLAQPGFICRVFGGWDNIASVRFWLYSSHAVIGKLDHRISMVTGLNVNHPFGEYLQVVNYGIGGHYEPHFDHATLNTGNRVATFMIYVSKSISAIFWWNLHRNGEGDVDTLHAGCPVLVGDKWVANKWIHEYGQEFTHRCTLNPDE